MKFAREEVQCSRCFFLLENNNNCEFVRFIFFVVIAACISNFICKVLLSQYPVRITTDSKVVCLHGSIM